MFGESTLCGGLNLNGRILLQFSREIPRGGKGDKIRLNDQATPFPLAELRVT